METNPLLARREIPLKERRQKALAIVVLTTLVVGGVWLFAGASADIAVSYVLLMAATAVLGLIFSVYFWFKKHDRAETKEGYRSVRRRIADDRHGRTWASRLTYNFWRFLTGIVVAAGLLVTLAGLGVLALQVYGYLKTGDWRSVSLLSIASMYLPWLDYPQSWFGLNEVLRKIGGVMPLSLTLVLLGGLLAGFGSGLRQRASK